MFACTLSKDVEIAKTPIGIKVQEAQRDKF